MSIEVMRLLQLAAHQPAIQSLQVKVAEEVANYLLNKKRQDISKLEETGKITVNVFGTKGSAPEALEFSCFDNNNNEVKLWTQGDGQSRRR